MDRRSFLRSTAFAVGVAPSARPSGSVRTRQRLAPEHGLLVGGVGAPRFGADGEVVDAYRTGQGVVQPALGTSAHRGRAQTEES